MQPLAMNINEYSSSDEWRGTNDGIEIGPRLFKLANIAYSSHEFKGTSIAYEAGEIVYTPGTTTLTNTALMRKQKYDSPSLIDRLPAIARGGEIVGLHCAATDIHAAKAVTTGLWATEADEACFNTQENSFWEELPRGSTALEYWFNAPGWQDSTTDGLG
ncbi:hypothetical protein C8R48DRAFT_674743 [Suillus tomentosus]|nr:hypothetical protein C8R48DRAFT_674743 [Suillus tomentosus]